MRMANLDRRSAPAAACAVCGVDDARVLGTTRLEDGTRITVCGSHKIAHRRSERLARSIEELCVLVGERRAS
jgi:hypothetical protein